MKINLQFFRFAITARHDNIYQILFIIPFLTNPHKNSSKDSLNHQDKNINKPLNIFKK